VLGDIGLEEIVGHPRRGGLGPRRALVEIIAVAAGEVARRSRRFGENLEAPLRTAIVPILSSPGDDDFPGLGCPWRHAKPGRTGLSRPAGSGAPQLPIFKDASRFRP